MSTNNYTTRVVDRPKLDTWYVLPDKVYSQRLISLDDPVRLCGDFPHCLWTYRGWTWYYDGLDGTVRNPWSFMSEQNFKRELRAAQYAAIERDVAGAI